MTTDSTTDKRQFTCECCGGTFDTGWTDEERDAEAKRNFPDLEPDDRLLVCDDCYKLIMAFNEHEIE